MKKILSVILAISLLAGLLGISVSAADTYPESDHDYANNTEKTWTYEYPETVAGLEIVFSDDCYVEPYNVYEYDSPLPGYLMTDEVMDTMQKYGYLEKGDEIEISDDFGYHIFFTGDELAGQTINVTGGRFTITLRSDSSVTGYGFKIDKIEEVEANAEESGIVNYIIDGKVAASACSNGSEYVILDQTYHNYHEADSNDAIVGWKTEDGTEYYYDNSRTNFLRYPTYFPVEAGKEYNLYPIYCKLGLTSEETFSFTNSRKIFYNEFGYYYTREAFKHHIIDWLATFGFSPLLPLGIAGAIFVTAFWPVDGWRGSCCGFPITALLQHYGKIDILSGQGVDSVSELEPTEEIQSTINFYNNAAIATHIVNHWAFDPGTKEYTRQLQNLYNTLESGTPVSFEFYGLNDPPLKAIAEYFKHPFTSEGTFIDAIHMNHGILLDGAFTDGEGNHIILAWDNESTEFSKGYADVLIINKDFTDIFYDGITLNGFAWNEDMSSFESFPTEGLPNPFAWHINFIEHIFELICHSITNLFN